MSFTQNNMSIWTEQHTQYLRGLGLDEPWEQPGLYRLP